MVLAAGFGRRLRPLTLSVPKPLVQVAGQTLIDRTLDRLEAAGVRKAVVNLHYKAEMLEAHLRRRTSPEIVFSFEEQLLDTGGGVRKALVEFGDAPFIVANSDMIWRDGFVDSLATMGKRFDPARMDVLLLMQPTVTALGYRGQGDYHMAADGKLKRRKAPRVSAFLFAGVQILHPRVFEGQPIEHFSLNRIYDAAEEAGRLYGVRHDGDWIEVGTPEGMALAERVLNERD
ncbi:MAG: nucleotidyltransferase family protein [Pseudomonadota bacterium]|nr:nucleotidyltransferase family protein [Pseudomonadota bacterium]